MKLFSSMFTRVMAWSRHRHAQYYLAGLSFAESSFFPIPPDVMLAPMSLAQPPRAWRFALIATVGSVLGGVAGYFIGVFFFDLIEPLLHQYGYAADYQRAREWFSEWGVLAVLIAGFSPIPYKVFTIAAGVLQMALLPFVLASALGRGARFFAVAGLMRLGGPRMEAMLHKYVDRIGWITVIVAVVLYFILRG
jgi:membrane protein YqaA with SNARE-associated domain